MREMRDRDAVRQLGQLLSQPEPVQASAAAERACARCGVRLRASKSKRPRQFCSVLCSQPLTSIGYANCLICRELFATRSTRERKTCRRPDCQRKYGNARRRNRDHIRYTAVSDITPEQELAMRKRARKCPLCGVKLTDKPGLPNSKHLDHILPSGIGGTHSHGNARIVCRTCNLSRPKDGSDFAGQLTLWAQAPAVVSRPDRRKGADRKTCRNGLHPWIPENIMMGGKQKRCRLCWEANRNRNGKAYPRKTCKCGAPFAAPGRTFMCPDCMDATARKAAELHASGLTWKQVAEQVGYDSGTGALDAAKRIGYRPPPGLAAAKAKAKAQPKPPRTCPDCGTPRRDGKGKGKGHGQPRCEPCSTARAWQAAEMRDRGMTLRAIADALGFGSITSVTNLMKTVVVIETRMGRPVSR